MADVTIKQHDTYPPLAATLSDAVGPVNLTGSTVRVILKDRAGPTVLAAACTITNAAGGKVSYNWLPADTAAARVYDGEFEVTWGDGTITTFPNDAYFSVEVKADLG